MKLLIITQVIDTEHPVLGFFHAWVEEFAEQCDSVHVICLEAGKHSLPANVTVHSLGKERTAGSTLGRSGATEKVEPGVSVFQTAWQKIGYLWRFYKYTWQLRREYDTVFVHMNQLYIVLGAILWRLSGKRVGLWYAHGAVTWSLYVATFLTQKVFTSTKEGMRIESPKRMIVGQGVNAKLFAPADRQPSSILKLVTFGRVSRSKNIDTLLQACALLKEKGVQFTFRIIGPATTPEEEEYANAMQKMTEDLSLVDSVTWVGPLPQRELPSELQQADMLIHDGSTNSLDKTLIEAALSGCVVTSSNPSYWSQTEALAPKLLFQPKDAAALAAIIERVSAASIVDREKEMQPVLDFFRSNYSIESLISGIVSKY